MTMHPPAIPTPGAAPTPELTTTPAGPEVRDFSHPTAPVRFRIGADEFQARPMISAQRMVQLAEMGEKIDAAEGMVKLSIFTEVFELALYPESLERFRARLYDDDNPIGMGQVGQVIEWLIEQYAGRPTPPPGT